MIFSLLCPSFIANQLYQVDLHCVHRLYVHPRRQATTDSLLVLLAVMRRWRENEEAFGEQGAMVGWSNYVLDTGKKLSCPTGGRHATLHATENNLKMFGQSVFKQRPGQGIPFRSSIRWIGCQQCCASGVQNQLIVKLSNLSSPSSD